MLDERVRSVLARLEAEDRAERGRGLPPAERSRAVAPTTGQFLFALAAPQTDCEVLELGASRGYSTLWWGAAVRYLGGRVLSLEKSPDAAHRWRENIDAAGLAGWCELLEGDAFDLLPTIDDVFDVVFIDAKKSEYEAYFGLARERVEPGGLIVADNVLSHQDELAAYTEARRGDPGLLTVTLSVDRGLELSVVLTDSLHLS